MFRMSFWFCFFSPPPFESATGISAYNFLSKPVSDWQLHYHEITLQITLNGTLWGITDLLISIQIKILLFMEYQKLEGYSKSDPYELLIQSPTSSRKPLLIF